MLQRIIAAPIDTARPAPARRRVRVGAEPAASFAAGRRLSALEACWQLASCTVVDPALIAGLERARYRDVEAVIRRIGEAGEATPHRMNGHAPAPAMPFSDAELTAAAGRFLGCAPISEAELLTLLRCAKRVTFGKDGRTMRIDRLEGPLHICAPTLQQLLPMARRIAAEPELRPSVRVATPRTIATAALEAGVQPLVQVGRVEPLHAAPPDEVADRTVSAVQRLTIGAVLCAMMMLVAFVPGLGLALTAVFAAIVVGAYSATRVAALFMDKKAFLARKSVRAGDLPIYTILIPLYREAKAVPHLVRALGRLDYPRDRLDIQFLVEADDTETRATLKAEAVDLPSRICVLPRGLPKTKPRALNAGLRQARGALTTIFDAEDRPDPDQLRVAAETFAAAGPDLAALQARLCIDHEEDNWLTRMFAIEYACQFERLLPMVANRGGLVLLGGTSNHFRTDVLTEVGGWDPYNVTEDADLAIRLRRRGYRIGVIDSDTHEEAPLSTKSWIKQRSRWFKGYVQTWLVHHREPRRLCREIGLADTVLINTFIVGAVAAALAHNAFLILLVLAATGLVPLFGGSAPVLLAGQMAMMLVSYGANFVLGAQVLAKRRGQRISPLALAGLPFYWVLMGCAVGLGIYDLIRRPHHWRKTEHGVAARPRRGAKAQRSPTR